MKSFDYYAVAFDGAVYCTECLPAGITEDREEVSPVFADSEWDYYPTCDKCGCKHDYVSLTEYGQRHEAISQALREHRDGEFDGLVVSDLSEVPEDYDGAVLHINERGNAELYSKSFDKLTSLGSAV